MIIEDIQNYIPCCEQEEKDKSLILSLMAQSDAVFSRESRAAHMTASAWIVNEQHDKVLMIYHKIYDSWAWTGGHADGEKDLLSVALREAREETGIEHIRALSPLPFSLEVLTVDGHEKRGEYVSSHLHLNVSYLCEAKESDPLRICEEENSGAAWFFLEDALRASSEPWFVERIYRKLNKKLSESES